MPETSLSNADISEDLKEEIALFRVLKPYLAHCLTINHEINNPLAGVLGYAEFLLWDKKGLTNNQIEGLEEILRCAERIKKLVENLCEEKIALTEKIDLGALTKQYEKVAKQLDQVVHLPEHPLQCQRSDKDQQ